MWQTAVAFGLSHMAERTETLPKLAELMKERGLSARDLATQAQIPERTVYRHVRGDVTPNLLQAAAYARALKCRVDDLLGDPEEAA